jgi:superfamily II DNA or RNA helicase
MPKPSNYYDYFRSIIPSQIWQRGSSYANYSIQDWEFDQKSNSVMARIDGSYDIYDTEIQKLNTGFDYNCDCPFEGKICKHVAALAMFLKKKNFRFEQNNSQDIVDVDFNDGTKSIGDIFKLMNIKPTIANYLDDKISKASDLVPKYISTKPTQLTDKEKLLNRLKSFMADRSDDKDWFAGYTTDSVAYNLNITPKKLRLEFWKVKGNGNHQEVSYDTIIRNYNQYGKPSYTTKADFDLIKQLEADDAYTYTYYGRTTLRELNHKQLYTLCSSLNSTGKLFFNSAPATIIKRASLKISFEAKKSQYSPIIIINYGSESEKLDSKKYFIGQKNIKFAFDTVTSSLFVLSNPESFEEWQSMIEDLKQMKTNLDKSDIAEIAKLETGQDHNPKIQLPAEFVVPTIEATSCEPILYLSEKEGQLLIELYFHYSEMNLEVGFVDDERRFLIDQSEVVKNQEIEIESEVLDSTNDVSPSTGTGSFASLKMTDGLNSDITTINSKQNHTQTAENSLVQIVTTEPAKHSNVQTSNLPTVLNIWISRNDRLENIHFHTLQQGFNDQVSSSTRLSGKDFLVNEEAVLFVTELLENLPEHWQVKGKEKLNHHNFFKAIPTLRLSEVNDWLNIEGEIDFGGEVWSIVEIANMVRKNKRFINLKNGGIGVMPKDWLEQHTELFELAEKMGDNLQISKWHLALLEDFAKTNGKATKSWKDQINKSKKWQDIQKLDKPIVNATLRDYQQVGYEWLNFLADNKVGGILADDMGLGKTLQTIAFLSKLYFPDLKKSKVIANSTILNVQTSKRLSASKKVTKPTLAPTLLVLPKTLIFNWQNELAKFAPGLTYTIFYGNTRDKEALKNLDTHLAITTYGTMLKDIHDLKTISWHGLILDESQQIKNPESLSFKALRLINAKFKLALSGTPVENNLEDLWSQMTIVNPGMLGSREFFRSKFALPIQKNKDEDQANKLRNLISPFILRRMKQQVAKELGDKVETTLTVEMTDKQRKLYDKVRFLFKSQIENEFETNNAGAKFKVLEGLTKLRQICCHPQLLDADSKADSAKLELMLETLQDVVKEGHKVLVFSQFTSMLSIVKSKLGQLNIPYSYLDGKTNKREQVVQEFTDNPAIPVFLISLKAGGVGINLTCADYVFIYDPWWNPAVESQAVDRTHRIGQDKTVFVYRFVTKDSVEEKIMELQETKKELVKNIISVDESLLKKLNLADIQKLFG